MRAPIPDEQAALLAAIIADPDADAPRLVYADWLQEHNQEEQAQYIRDAIQLARMGPRVRGRKPLEKRVEEAEQAHGEEWAKAVGVNGGRPTYRRGFPAYVYYSNPAEFFAEADALFRFVPLRSLAIASREGALTAADMRRLAAMPGLARLRTLGVWNLHKLRPTSWSVLLESPHLRGLTALSLANCSLRDPVARAVASSPVFAGVAKLDLVSNQIGADGARAILDSPHLTRLTDLWLESNSVLDETAAGPVLTELRNRLGAGLHNDGDTEYWPDDEPEGAPPRP